MAQSKHIDYIDLIKGITIILVLYYHCPVPEYNKPMLMLSYTRITTFVFLAGLFFSSYGGSFKRLIVKKINRYIIPFAFFFILYLPQKLIGAGINDVKALIYDVVINCNFCQNYPIWFLLMLLWLSLLTFAIEKATPTVPKWIKAALSIALSLAVFTANNLKFHYEVTNHWLTIVYNLRIVISLILFPVYYLPYLYRQQILQPHSHKLMWICLPIALTILYFSANRSILYSLCVLGDSYLRLAAGISSGVFILFFIGYMLRHLPYFSYVGRYSIIIFGTHSIVLRQLQLTFGISNCYVMFAIAALLAPAIIYVFRRLFPHLTAQKEPLSIDERGRIKISFKD